MPVLAVLPTLTTPRDALIAELRMNQALLARLEKKAPSDTPVYREFRRRYYADPMGFARDCIAWKPGEGPADYQDGALARLARPGRVCLRGPHGLGKSAMLSWVILWFALTRDVDYDWKIPCTASAWRQLTKFLWPEVHKWSRRLDWSKIGRAPYDEKHELLQLGIKGATGEAFALASNKSELLEGAHAEELLYIYDEAKVIPDPTWDSTEGAFSGGGRTWAFAASTPGEPRGRFYQIQAKQQGFEDWQALRVTLDDVIRAGRTNPTWVEQRRRQWGEGSAIFKNRVLGEFASSDTDGVIPLAWVEAANARWLEFNDLVTAGKAEWPPFTCIAADIGGGGDAGVKARRHGMAIKSIERDHNPDTMVATGRVKGILDGLGGYAVVDVVGIGAGVVHRLKELRARVYAFVANARSEKRDRSNELGFADLRAESWWGVRELLDPANGEDMMLPPDDLLTGDLTAPTYRMVSGGKIRVESKDDLRKPERLGRSTDTGDAVVMAFADVRSMQNPGEDVVEYYRQQAEALAEKKKAQADK